MKPVIVTGLLLLLITSVTALILLWTDTSGDPAAGVTQAQEDVGQTGDRQPAQDRFTCTVTRVHDGDGPIHCAELDMAGKPIKVRLEGVAVREIDESCRPTQPCPAASGASAKAHLEKLALSKVLQCRKSGTSYGRTVASCTASGLDLGCAMIRSGTALRWPRYDPERRLARC